MPDIYCNNSNDAEFITVCVGKRRVLSLLFPWLLCFLRWIVNCFLRLPPKQNIWMRISRCMPPINRAQASILESFANLALFPVVSCTATWHIIQLPNLFCFSWHMIFMNTHPASCIFFFKFLGKIWATTFYLPSVGTFVCTNISKHKNHRIFWEKKIIWLPPIVHVNVDSSDAQDRCTMVLNLAGYRVSEWLWSQTLNELLRVTYTLPTLEHT